MSFSLAVRVYYEDTDVAGVVYYANYLKFFERARTEYLRQLGIEQDQLAAEYQVIFVVRKASIDYRRPARFNDHLTVTAEISKVRAASILFQQRISLLTAPDDCLCEASVLIACLDRREFSPTAIPKTLLEAMHLER